MKFVDSREKRRSIFQRIPTQILTWIHIDRRKKGGAVHGEMALALELVGSRATMNRATCESSNEKVAARVHSHRIQLHLFFAHESQSGFRMPPAHSVRVVLQTGIN